MTSTKAKDLVDNFEREALSGLVLDKAKEKLLTYIEQLEKQVSDAGWEASARHAQATGGWQ